MPSSLQQAPFVQPPLSSVPRGSLAAMALPRLWGNTALFLDFDGTLIDIAAQPELILVPADLAGVLRQLAVRLEGALATVSGRTLQDLDHYLSPLVLPLAAEHGAVQRFSNGRVLQLAAPDLRDVASRALALAASHAGLKVEVKAAAVALHYRHAPALEVLCLKEMAEAIRLMPEIELLKGKCVVEVKAAGVNKGTAVAAFMQQPAFAGRIPIFAGDDTTDESAFSAVQAMGGAGIKVGPGDSLARFRCTHPEALRQWLQSGIEGSLA